MCRKYITHELRHLVLEIQDTIKRREVPDGQNITASSVYRTIVWEKPFVPPVVMSYPLVKNYFKDLQAHSPNPRAVPLALFHRSLATAAIMASSLTDVRTVRRRPAFKTQSMSQFTSTLTLLLSLKHSVWMTLTRKM
jgi:hypothetical protein